MVAEGKGGQRREWRKHFEFSVKNELFGLAQFFLDRCLVFSLRVFFPRASRSWARGSWKDEGVLGRGRKSP
jgi:hypothetical protein